MTPPEDYQQIKNANSSINTAQWWLVFAIFVANKPADVTYEKMGDFISRLNWYAWDPDYDTLFDKIRTAHRRGLISGILRQVKTGQYKRIEKAILFLLGESEEDPAEWSLEYLESIPGVGPKTARWYKLLVDPSAPVAALDTHILKFLRENGYDVPKSTPAYGKQYKRLESVFVSEAERLGLTSRELDFFVWSIYRNGGKVTLKEK